MIFVGVCGGREYSDRVAVRGAIAALDERVDGELVIIQGGARGADALAADIADSLGLHVIEVKALWGAHGKGAGPRRNEVMAEILANMPHAYLLAFPGGPGTADMVRRCRIKGVEVIEVKP